MVVPRYAILDELLNGRFSHTPCYNQEYGKYAASFLAYHQDFCDKNEQYIYGCRTNLLISYIMIRKRFIYLLRLRSPSLQFGHVQATLLRRVLTGCPFASVVTLEPD